jgi:hypothetical protein
MRLRIVAAFFYRVGYVVSVPSGRMFIASSGVLRSGPRTLQRRSCPTGGASRFDVFTMPSSYAMKDSSRLRTEGRSLFKNAGTGSRLGPQLPTFVFSSRAAVMPQCFSLSSPPVVPLARPRLKVHCAQPCIPRCSEHRSLLARVTAKSISLLRSSSMAGDDVVAPVLDKAGISCRAWPALLLKLHRRTAA